MMRSEKLLYILLIFLLGACTKKKEEIKKTYYENGNVKVEYVTQNGEYHGKAKFYYDNGTIKSIVDYRHGREDGVYRSYHPNGILKVKSFYNDGVKIDTSRIYDKDGELIELQVYDQRGVLNDFMKFDEEGKLKKEAMTPLFYPRIDTMVKDKEYKLEIRLANRVFPETKVIVGSLTEDGYLTDTTDVLPSNKNNFFTYTIKPEKVGVKIFSGVIDNFRKEGDSTEIYTFPFSIDFTIVDK